MPGLELAVVLNIAYLGGAALALNAVLLLAYLVKGAPTRPCHRCGEKVPLGLRVCRHCGYDFSPVRFTR
jgi:hypothetical protein